MPQLVKGAKYVFGWSLVNSAERITVPAEAGSEYNLKTHDKIFILPGSKTSKGFAITTERLMKDTIFSAIIKDVAGIADARKSSRGLIEKDNKPCAWTEIDEGGCFTLDPEILKEYSAAMDKRGKKKVINIPGESHSQAYSTGLLLLAGIDARFAVNVTEAGDPDPVYAVHWAGTSEGGPQDDLRWGLDRGDESLTGNPVCMNTYLEATEQYIAFCKDNGYSTKVVFTTGPVDGYTGENGYQRHIKHEYIRD
jgi:hypothetical protein